MKVGLGTALSVAGVLGAGATAYALNSAVLNSATPSFSVPNSVVATTVASADSSSAANPINAQSVAVDAHTTTYAVGNVGKVVIDTSSGAIVVRDAIPSSGYVAEPTIVDTRTGSTKVHFSNGKTRIEFAATMVNGSVTTSVKTEADTPRPGISGKPHIPGSVAGDDHDGDNTDNPNALNHSDDKDD
jgi:hypothetical protein